MDDEKSQDASTNDETRQSGTDVEKLSADTRTPPEAQPPASNTAQPTATPGGIPDVPNGGLQAWLHVLGAAMLFFNTWGILNAFGVFQTYYESGELFTKSSSDISWIGAIQAYMVLTVGCVTGPIYDRGYLRTLLVIGSFGVVFGHMMLSLCHNYWQVLLAQGFVVGIGAGCLFVPSVAILPTYFNTRLGLAVGLAAAGSSLGGVIYPIVLFRLLDRIGFAWSVRVIGFIALGTLLISITVMKMRFKPPKARAIIDWAAFTDVPYMAFVVTSLIGFMGLYTILFYLSYYAESQRITDSSMAFYLVPIFNAASCFGRTLPNALSDKTGPFNLIAPGSGIVGILILCMMAVKSEAAIIIVAILVGFFSGVFIGLPPVCFVMLTKDKTKIGTRIGMGFGMISFGVLAGGPGGGSVLGVNEPLDWRGLWIFGGVSGIVAGLGFAGIAPAYTGVDDDVPSEDATVVAPLSSEHTHTIIFLHGREDFGEDLARYFFDSKASDGRSLAEIFPSVKWVFPTARLRYSAQRDFEFSSSSFADALKEEEIISQWFDVWDIKNPEKKQDLMIPGIQESVEEILKVIKKESEIVPQERIILGGISQGCATAMISFLSSGLSLGGFIGLSSWLPFQSDFADIPL
ncbi:Aspyridones efflux apdF [Hyphodiscus hymeniophilus]|uniref:Aspyridones efflux apdF n=1 Tax=Hyphodiscus hymeniophilus TaxID=353542 RepID=A0A9P6VPP5_9HELO|nr:Aspyridones efflux apdF [Hyphodiscus hymeniophilus]